jgi:general L-amino acid transport system substrate-binding protein
MAFYAVGMPLGETRLKVMRIIGVTLLVVATLLPAMSAVAAEPTLSVVKKRGKLLCGVNGQLPGFSAQNARKAWAGFEIDYCRAIAAASLGDPAKVDFVPLTTSNRFDALRNGQIDVLVRNTTVSLDRTVNTGIRPAAVIFIDAQRVVAAKSMNVTSVSTLDKQTVCTLRNTPYEARLQEWMSDRKLSVTSRLYDNQETLYRALYDGECKAVTQDVSALAPTILASGRAGEYIVLPEVVAKDPLGLHVRAGDDQWLDIVRWTHNALLEAEEHSVTQANAASLRDSGSPIERRLLGSIPGFGKKLGLDESWAFNAIHAVGNYGEIYDRNVGSQSPLKFARGVNALWNFGGVFYPLSFQ